MRCTTVIANSRDAHGEASLSTIGVQISSDKRVSSVTVARTSPTPGQKDRECGARTEVTASERLGRIIGEGRSRRYDENESSEPEFSMCTLIRAHAEDSRWNIVAERIACYLLLGEIARKGMAGGILSAYRYPS
jgi:hypothetical protein